MKTDIDRQPDRNDILGRRLNQIPHSVPPAGIDERIMVRVRREAARLRRRTIFLSILAGTTGGLALVAIVFAALAYTNVDLTGTFSYFEALLSTENVRALESPFALVLGCALVVVIFYLCLNGIINNRARRRQLLEEHSSL